MFESESDDESVEKVGDGKGKIGLLARTEGGGPLMDASTRTSKTGRGGRGQTGRDDDRQYSVCDTSSTQRRRKQYVLTTDTRIRQGGIPRQT